MSKAIFAVCLLSAVVLLLYSPGPGSLDLDRPKPQSHSCNLGGSFLKLEGPPFLDWAGRNITEVVRILDENKIVSQALYFV